jgi:hypothetical protein
MEQMGDMLDSVMRWANVAHRQEIGARCIKWCKLNNLQSYLEGN